MTRPRAPKALFWLAVAALVVYELWAIVVPTGDTISEMFWRGERGPLGVIMVLVFGILGGHLFWQRE